MDVTFAAWAALVAGLLALLLLDLFVLHRGTQRISIRNAAWSTAGFIGIGLLFGAGLGLINGASVSEQYYAGYLLELSLSMDNVFAWALIFTAFSIPPAYQHRVLFYGIFGALILRGAFVALGAELLQTFSWIVYVFGAVLLYSGVRLLRGQEGIDPEQSRMVHLIRQLPTTKRLLEAHLFVRKGDVAEADRPSRPPLWGRWYVTPMLAVLLVIELTDLIFAVDSIPAIFGVTREPFLVFSATALALIGLRSMYFLLAGARERFAYLDIGLALILTFIGAKFILSDLIHIGVGISLAVIVVVITASIAVSLLREDPARPSSP